MSFATVDTSTPGATILNDVLACYKGGPNATTLVGRLYAEDATFEDGAIRVTGAGACAAQFSALSAMFSEVTITATGPPTFGFETPGGASGHRPATRLAGESPAAQPTPSSITLPCTQAFRVRGPLPATLTIEATIQLTLDPSTGRITHHKDAWAGLVNLPPWLRLRRLPFLITPPSPIRALNGFASTWLLRAAGYGTSEQQGPAGAATATGGRHTHQE